MTPKRLDLPTASGAAHDAWLPNALETLQRGGLVILPTETVYGVAARADDPEVLARLARLKGRPEERAFTWHVAGSDALERFPHTTAVARRLAQRYWPGPLTLVLPGVPEGLELVARDGLTGVRCVAGEAASALCAAAPFPLVMSSANAHGASPATDADSLTDLPLEDDDLVLAGGATTLGESSTVLRCGGGRFEILREGLHDIEALRRAGGLRLGFACTGNTCRSPMAEVLGLRAIAARLAGGQAPDAHADQRELLDRFGFGVTSMGLAAYPGSPASGHSVESMATRGLDLSGHSSQPADLELLASLDAVYTMTRSHRDALIGGLRSADDGRFAELAERVQLLDPEGGDISDPFGGDAGVYETSARDIAAAIEARVVDWA